MRSSLFTSSFKRNIFRIFKIVLLIVTIGSTIAKIFSTLNGPKNWMDVFYKLPENTVDVLSIGSSHVYCSVIPVEMWNDAGISAYDLSAGSQSIWYSYFYLEEALKTQDPKVVFLDVYTIVTGDDYFIEKAQMNLLQMKPSYTKYRAVLASESQDAWDIFWGFPIWHNRYKNMTNEHYYELTENFAKGQLLGYSYMWNVEPYDNVEDVSEVTEITPISEKAELYLRKCIELCQKNGIDVALMNAPWPLITAETQSKYNYVKQIAESYGVDFIDGCLLEDEMGIDWTTDSMGDGGHLNYDGALKFTKYLIGYLKKNYDLEDHHQDNKYVFWQQESDRYQTYLDREQFYIASNLVSYINSAMSDANYVAVISVENCADKIPPDVLTYMEKFGISTTDGSLLIKDGGKIVASENGTNSYTRFVDIGNKDTVSVIREVNSETNSQTIYVSGEEADKVSSGINIVVYNKTLKMMVDIVGFDAENDWTLVR